MNIFILLNILVFIKHLILAIKKKKKKKSEIRLIRKVYFLLILKRDFSWSRFKYSAKNWKK